jgi:hypothetical protein
VLFCSPLGNDKVIRIGRNEAGDVHDCRSCVSLQRSGKLAAGDTILFRIPHAYIKHRRANIKHFLATGSIRSVREPNRRVKLISIGGRNMMIIVIAATHSHCELECHECTNKHDQFETISQNGT